MMVLPMMQDEVVFNVQCHRGPHNSTTYNRYTGTTAVFSRKLARPNYIVRPII